MKQNCACWDQGLHIGMTYEQLTNFVKSRRMCSDRQYICPNVDRELRRADTERERRKYYNKRLKAAGYSDEEIAQMPHRRRRSAPEKVTKVAIDLNFDQPKERRRVRAS